MKSFNLIIILVTVIGLMTVTMYQLLLSSEHEILIESDESKTLTGDAVFNKIKRQVNGDAVIWSMQQSHHGLKANAYKWDELRITIRAGEATFEQMQEGKPVPYRVSCFVCHANGARAIRPNWQSPNVSYSLKDRLYIAAWNTSIKLAGVIKAQILPQQENLGTPLWFQGDMDRETLEIKTCLLCHQGESSGLISWPKRSKLNRQHAATISHLVKKGDMPPFPFRLSEEEKRQLARFIDGE